MFKGKSTPHRLLLSNTLHPCPKKALSPRPPSLYLTTPAAPAINPIASLPHSQRGPLLPEGRSPQHLPQRLEPIQVTRRRQTVATIP